MHTRPNSARTSSLRHLHENMKQGDRLEVWLAPGTFDHLPYSSALIPQLTVDFLDL